MIFNVLNLEQRIIFRGATPWVPWADRLFFRQRFAYAYKNFLGSSSYVHTNNRKYRNRQGSVVTHKIMIYNPLSLEQRIIFRGATHTWVPLADRLFGPAKKLYTGGNYLASRLSIVLRFPDSHALLHDIVTM